MGRTGFCKPLEGTLRGARPLLLSLSLGFFGLSLAYQLVTPIGETPDELSHFRVIAHIVRHRTWPVIQPGQPTPPHESTQFPLYYGIAALATTWINYDDEVIREEANPHHVGAPAPPPEGWNNRNSFVHDPREIRLWRGEFLAFRIARLISTLAGLSAVLLTYRLARRVFPRSPRAALLAAALLVFHPRLIFTAASVSNDAMAIAGAALALNAFADYVLRPSPRKALIAGLAMGMAILSKASNVGLIPIWILSGALAKPRRPRFGSWVLELTLGLLGAALLAGGWMAWNMALYRDPLALRAHMEIIHWQRPNLPTLADWWFIFLRARETAFFSFGATEGIVGERWIYWIEDLFLVATLFQLLRKPWKSRLNLQSASENPSLIFVLFAWVCVVILEFFYWNIHVEAALGRLLFVGLPAFWLIVLWAWEIPGWPARTVYPLYAWLAFSSSLSLIGLGAYLWPAFHRPLRTEQEIPASLERLEWIFEDLDSGEPLVRLIGFQATPRRLMPGQTVHLHACWQLLRPSARNYSMTYQIWAGANPSRGERLGQVDTYPGGGSWPMRFWPPGGVLCDTYLITLRPPAQLPTALTLLVGVYDRSQPDLPQLPRREGAGMILFAGVGKPGPAEEFRSWEARFEPGILLLRHEVIQATPEEIRLRLIWKATSSLPPGLHVFLHLLDPNGRWIAGGDGPPRMGDYPTEFWMPGDIVEEERWIRPQPPLLPGEYRLHTGWYELTSGRRLRAFDASGHPIPDDSVPLGRIRLASTP